MLMDVVKIGNSKGIRIPANILKDLNVKDKVKKNHPRTLVNSFMRVRRHL